MSAHRGFIAGLGIAQIISWGSLIYAFPLLATPMAADFTWSRSAIFGLASLALAVAGLAAYPVGRAIDRGHGRSVMAGGSLLATLALLVWSHVDAGWLLPPLFMLIGLAQAMTLYEPGFAVVSRRFGPQARRGITALTLWGGFASTLFVPLTQFLLDRLGWRGALEMLAAINLFLALPLHLRVIDRAAPMLSPRAAATDEAVIPWVLRQPAFWGLMAAFTLYYALFSGISFHLYPLLGEQGLSTASVVLVLTLIGPAQVVGRVIVAAIAERAPIRQVGVGTILALPMALALLLLPGGGVPALALFAILYGAANGIMTIIRGTAVPEMLTPRAYGAVNGLLSLPGSVCKALAPLLVALVWDLSGSYRPVLWLGIVACVPILAGFLLAALTWPPDRSSPPP